MYKVTQSPLRVQIVFDFCDSDFVFLHTPHKRLQGFFQDYRVAMTWRGRDRQKDNLNLMGRSELE